MAAVHDTTPTADVDAPEYRRDLNDVIRRLRRSVQAWATLETEAGKGEQCDALRDIVACAAAVRQRVAGQLEQLLAVRAGHAKRRQQVRRAGGLRLAGGAR